MFKKGEISTACINPKVAKRKEAKSKVNNFLPWVSNEVVESLPRFLGEFDHYQALVNICRHMSRFHDSMTQEHGPESLSHWEIWSTGDN